MQERQRGTYIKLNRKILQDQMFDKKPYDDLRAWLWMLVNAQAFPTIAKLEDGTEIYVGRGQLFRSKRKLAEEFGWTVKQVKSWEQRMRRRGSLSYEGRPKGRQKGSLYTVENYTFYQDSDTPKGPIKGPTKGPRNKKEKKVNNPPISPLGDLI